MSSLLITILQRIAERLHTFYVDLSAHSVYNPDIEDNPARTRWKVLARRIKDGSFFGLSRENSWMLLANLHRTVGMKLANGTNEAPGAPTQATENEVVSVTKAEMSTGEIMQQLNRPGSLRRPHRRVDPALLSRQGRRPSISALGRKSSKDLSRSPDPSPNESAKYAGRTREESMGGVSLNGSLRPIYP